MYSYRISASLLIVLFLTALVNEMHGQNNEALRPNIVFIMTDDQSCIPIEAASASQSRPFGFNGDPNT